MAISYVLSLLSLVLSDVNGFFPAKTCTWKYCKGTEWKDDWTPSIPTGKCVKQHRNVHVLYGYKKYNFFCPPPMPCIPLSTQYRTVCK